MNPMRKVFALSLAASLLAACTATSPRSEPRRLLLSYDGPAATAPVAARPRLVVRGVTVPDYLDRRELVRRVSASEIARNPSAYWAERPSKAITRWVTQGLAAQRGELSVESFSTADGRAPDGMLALTIDRFEPDAEGLLRLRGSWLYAPSGQRAAVSGRFDADVPAADRSAEAQVAAMQTALQGAVQALARELPAIATAAPARP